MHYVISEHVGETGGFNHGHSISIHMEHEMSLNHLFLFFCYSCVEYQQVLVTVEHPNVVAPYVEWDRQSA
jgi:hypothetical protein